MYNLLIFIAYTLFVISLCSMFGGYAYDKKLTFENFTLRVKRNAFGMNKIFFDDQNVISKLHFIPKRFEFTTPNKQTIEIEQSNSWTCLRMDLTIRVNGKIVYSDPYK